MIQLATVGIQERQLRARGLVIFVDMGNGPKIISIAEQCQKVMARLPFQPIRSLLLGALAWTTTPFWQPQYVALSCTCLLTVVADDGQTC